MPYQHARCFQGIADAERCMIASRSVGRFATGLILENYASKGFKIKAKSCNWGPMAGFVMSDPRFSKNGAEGGYDQLKLIQKAFKEGATQTPLFISNRRRIELETMGCMQWCSGEGDSLKYRAAPRSGGLTLEFELKKKSSGVPGAYGLPLWAVCYSSPAMQPPPIGPRRHAGVDGDPLQCQSLVNPDLDESVRGTYRQATTGDYDLWGIWPRVENADPRGLDARMVPLSDRLPLSFSTFSQFESPEMGNMTGRLAGLKDRLNQSFRAAGYSGGNMVHHSDETGRPGVSEVELEFIAFLPGQSGRARFIKSMADYRELLRECISQYYISINGAWQSQLGFDVSAGNHYLSGTSQEVFSQPRPRSRSLI